MGERKEKLGNLAKTYEESGYQVLAIDEGYPGIFTEEVPEHELEGRVDILVEDSEVPFMKILQVGYTKSMNPQTLVEKYEKKQDRADKATQYFEDLDLNPYNLEGEALLVPEGNLRVLKDIWEETTGVFTWNQAVEAVSEPGRLGNMKGSEIMPVGLSSTKTELYEVNEEYEEIIDLFNKGVV